ncbi:MAG TPA: FAD-binding protein, partial [Acidothermaceae bacterium]
MLDTRDAAAGRSTLLADYTTIRLGGHATTLVWADDEPALIEQVTRAEADGTPVLVLGGGSNLIVADAGFDGVVVRVASHGTRVDRDGEQLVLHVAAGEIWDDVVSGSLSQGLAGLECLSGIPGLAGATPIQNVGAYGCEISSLISAVRVLDRQQQRTVVLTGADCRFGYRTSALRGGDRYV